MSPAEFKAIRLKLGLTQPQLARLLGYVNVTHIAALETEAAYGRAIPHHTGLLMRAYADGYRPADWPKA